LAEAFFRICFVIIPVHPQNSTINKSLEKSIFFNIEPMSFGELGTKEPTVLGDLMNFLRKVLIFK